jgi:DNA-directed RNA polymerase subunit beta
MHAVTEAVLAGRPIDPELALPSVPLGVVSFRQHLIVEDLGETMQLSFTNPYLEPEKYSIDECKERGKTYALASGAQELKLSAH